FLVSKRALGIFVAAHPMLAHRRAGKLVVLSVSFIGLLLVDDVKDSDVRQYRELSLELPLLVRELVLNPGQRMIEARLPAVDAAKNIGIVAHPRGIHDFLVTPEHILNVARQYTPSAEQIDLEYQRIEIVVLIEQVLQRRI